MMVARVVLFIFNALGVGLFAVSIGHMFGEPWWKIVIAMGFAFGMLCNCVWLAYSYGASKNGVQS